LFFYTKPFIIISGGTIAGKDVSAIASKYDVDDNQVLMIIHAMKS